MTLTAGELSHQVLILITSGGRQALSPGAAVLVRDCAGHMHRVAGISTDGMHVILVLSSHSDVTIGS